MMGNEVEAARKKEVEVEMKEIYGRYGGRKGWRKGKKGRDG